jgi:hypothetical protein
LGLSTAVAGRLGLRRDSFLQRLFSTFPDGPPGIGLLCLRLGTVFLLLHFAITGPSKPSLIAAVAAVALLPGFWTPVAGTVIAVDELWIAFSGYSSQPGDLWTHILAAAVGAALALLGPGAWSVDARRFGRKLLTFGSGTQGRKRTPLK